MFSEYLVLVKKAYADTPLGQLHYLYAHGARDGAHRVPILLLHMSASSSKCYYKMMEALCSLGYACFAPDMPGFGASFDPIAGPPSISWYADLYHETFSRFPEFADGCHIVGHHSGGVIGTELAAGYTGFCRTLTCVGPTVMSKAERVELSKTFLEPFNKPVVSGNHLQETWKYLRWEGIPESEMELMQREALDHIRAWKGRSQIYSCVWAYDCAAAMAQIPENCKILGICARDDVLWPYFANFIRTGRAVEAGEITGGNFGPDLDAEAIVTHVVSLITGTK
jgi:pimeloyl-ACP methyl ester carboxylesterase